MIRYVSVKARNWVWITRFSGLGSVVVERDRTIRLSGANERLLGKQVIA
jgi:hypothetical protein